jgi:hypothetical protein
MATKTVAQLQAELDALKRQLGLSGRYPATVDPETQTDFVEHGSDRHAALLGLKKASDGDKPQMDGWTLEDIVSFGPNATPEFLEQYLRQKVNELTTKMPKTQSHDPREAHFAPVLWQPRQPFSRMTE